MDFELWWENVDDLFGHTSPKDHVTGLVEAAWHDGWLQAARAAQAKAVAASRPGPSPAVNDVRLTNLADRVARLEAELAATQD